MWDPRGRGKGGDLLAFADTEGYVGVFEKVYPSSEGGGGGGGVEGVESDPLVNDSLLMEVCISHIPLSTSDRVIAATNDHTSSLPSPSPALPLLRVFQLMTFLMTTTTLKTTSWIQLVVVTMETKLVEGKMKKEKRTTISPIFANGGGWRWRWRRGVRG